MLKFDITPQSYQSTKPYPYYYMDSALDQTFAHTLQREILTIPPDQFDRYNNPFEQKFTLRDKYSYPPNLQTLFTYLTSQEFLQKLSTFTGYNLYNDPTRNFWGVHKYNSGDYLDIHVDASIHPTTKTKKQVTLGIYLSVDWEDTYGGELEIWFGDCSSNPDAKIHECIAQIIPKFNRLIIFTCDDNSWHGNPNVVNCPDTSQRIFLTLSYLSDNTNYKNTKAKALFIARPGDVIDEEKDKLRLLRADPERCNDIYRINP